MLARLTIHLPRQPTRTFLLREDQSYLVGRDPACEVVIEDGRVSREHARLSSTGDAWELANLGSKNGLTLDGRAVEGGKLETACWIGFGGVMARYEPLSQDAAWAMERRRKLRSTLEAHRQLAHAEESAEALLERLLSSVIEIGQADRGFVLLAVGDADFQIVASSGITPNELERQEFRGSVSAVSRVLEGGAPIAESDALEDTDLGGRPSIVGEGIRGLICLPMSAAGRTIGAIYADSRRPGTAFDELDVEILGALASHAALSLWVVGLDRELKDLAANLATETAGLARETRGLADYPAWSSLSAAAAGALGETA